MIAGLPATDCGSSCPQSSGDAEGSSRPSENSCLRGAETPKLSQAGGASRQQSPAVPHDPAAIAASFNPHSDSAQAQNALVRSSPSETGNFRIFFPQPETGTELAQCSRTR